MDNIINTLIGTAIASGLYFFCEISIEMALLVGFLAIIAYSLGDINRHLRD